MGRVCLPVCMCVCVRNSLILERYFYGENGMKLRSKMELKWIKGGERQRWISECVQTMEIETKTTWGERDIIMNDSRKKTPPWNHESNAWARKRERMKSNERKEWRMENEIQENEQIAQKQK